MNKELQPDSTLSHYRIVSKIGAGGMGEVYLAQDTKLALKVALKILPADLAANQDRMGRFVQEAKAASAMNHPNIVTIHEINEKGSNHFIATEFIEGETLRERMQKLPFNVGQSLDISAQIASALAAAHAAGVVHRDVKPENVMLRRDGIIKVLDFGLAKLTKLPTPESIDTEAVTRANMKTDPGLVLGTAIYMSPEQARGMPVDARTDIFSLGVVLYEMIAGRLPFEGANKNEIMASILGDKEPAPLARFTRDVPGELEHIVSKALRKDREERYQTVKDMLIDLKDLRRDLEVQAQIERTAPPDLSVPRQVVLKTKTDFVQSTAETMAHPASSAEYIVSQVKLHKRAAFLTLGLLVLTAVAATFWYFKNARAVVLTEKDSIVLADFVNTTGDAVFDGALKQALAILLEQSPFLNIFPDQRVRETLRFMNRSAEERVTKDVAREICQRQGLKAYLAGSISNLGRHYVLTLEAVNAQTGEALARQQVEAESKERVLSAIGQAATKLREKLGETLASIRKYDAPIEQVTTASLEALKAYSLGREQHYKGNYSEAIPLIQRAIELDPNFARAYAGLSYSSGNSGQRQLAREAMQKAFELRERTSEYEKLKITADYYWAVEADVEKAIEALGLVTRTYPRDYTAHGNLIGRYVNVGRCEQAIEEGREAVRLNPNVAYVYDYWAAAFRCLNRFDEAKAIYEQALAQKLDTVAYHADLYRLGFVRGDTAAMQQQLDWLRGKPNEYEALFWQAEAAAFQGQIRRARELNSRGAEAELSRGLKDNAAATFALNASTAAAVGDCQQSREDAARASALPRNASSFFRTAIALALCGELGQAQSLADEYAEQFPKGTLVNAIWLPAIRAAVGIRRNDPAQAIQSLQPADRYDRVGDYWPQYLRGQAYLAEGKGAEASAEFQKILDRRGLAPVSVLYPLAQLGLARAAVLRGDTEKARQAYQDFFARWKDADLELPILIEARKEYEKLK